jgi:hypothetical protein
MNCHNWLGAHFPLQGWASQAIFRVESSPSHFEIASSRVKSSHRDFRVESSRVKLILPFFHFLVIFLKNVKNEFFRTLCLVPGFYEESIE